MRFIPVETEPYAIGSRKFTTPIYSTHKQGERRYIVPRPAVYQNSIFDAVPFVGDNRVVRQPRVKARRARAICVRACPIFSKSGDAEVAFERLIAKAEFKHIILSYSSDGIMSKEYIESVLKLYGKKESSSRQVRLQAVQKQSRVERRANTRISVLYRKKPTQLIMFRRSNFIGGKYDSRRFSRRHMPARSIRFSTCSRAVQRRNKHGRGQDSFTRYSTSRCASSRIHNKRPISPSSNRYVVKRAIQKLGLSKENKEAYMRLRDKYNGTHITRRDCRDLFC